MAQEIVLGVLGAAVVALLVYFVHSTRKKAQNASTIPGFKPTDRKTGNLPEIAAAGSLHQYMRQLHAAHGPIASLWMGELYIVSVATPELFKECSQLYNRPVDLFSAYEPFWSRASITYSMGEEWKARRRLYDQAYGYNVVCQEGLPIFQTLVDELKEKWMALPPQEHVPVRETLFDLAIKSISQASFGKTFKDERTVSSLRECYDICFSEIERRITGDQPDTERIKTFEKYRDTMIDHIRAAIEDRRHSEEEGYLLLDIFLKSDYSQEQILADSITYFVAGFHTTGLFMTWGLYYLAMYPDIQERCYEEMIDVLGQESIREEAIKDLVYLKQVMDETLRCSILAPYSGRIADENTVLADHKVPAGVPVFQAVGVVFEDPVLWPDPNRFDPERFSEANRKSRDRYAYEPFGFAGGRRCPASKFSYIEATVFLCTLLRKFRVKLVEGQTVVPVYGLVTHPKDEIWITVEKRDQTM